MHIQSNTGELAKALAAAQLEMDAAVKDSKNPFFKSKYADLDSVLSVIRPVLGKHGIAFTQPLESDENGYYIVTELLHISGEKIGSRLKLILNKHDMQGLGAAATYARRYCAASICGCSQIDDDGNEASGKVAQEVKEIAAKATQQAKAVVQSKPGDFNYIPGPLAKIVDDGF